MATTNLTINPAVNNAAAVTELIDAINAAHENSEPDTINLFPSGTYTLTAIDSYNPLNGNNGLPFITDTNGITLNGNGATIERATNAPDFRIFSVFRFPWDTVNPILNLNNLTIRNGLAIDRETSQPEDDGGGIHNFLGILNITNCTFSGNSAGDGGGIFNHGGTLTVTNSTFSGNSTFANGGAIFNKSRMDSPGILTLINSTITNNTANSNNSGDDAGGGVFSTLDSTVTIKNTIVAGNFDPTDNSGVGESHPDVSGNFTSDGYNLIGDATGSTGFTATGDRAGTRTSPIDPKLAPLQNNGGSTPTHALLPGSPAINAGNNAFATLPTDQRGAGFSRIMGDRADIGSYEAQINLVISEIAYNPASTQPAWEWIELYNAGPKTIDITGFVIDDDDGSALSAPNIASGAIAPGKTAILYNADALNAADFTAAWGTEINLVPVTNWAELDNSDRLGLWESFSNYKTGFDVAIDQVNYNNSTPWPSDNNPASIYLTNLTANNNIGTNWKANAIGTTTPTFKAYESANAGGNSGLDIGSPGSTDSTAPVADLNVTNITTAGGTTHTFSVEYSDNRAVDVSTNGLTDIVVTSPTGEKLPATLTSVTPTGNNTPVTATYQITPPGGTWDAPDKGTYTVQLQAGEVSDTSGNFISAQALGTFQVNFDTGDLNNSPKFTSKGVTAATEDAVYTYNITTTDPDKGDALTLRASTLPPWLTLTDNGDGTAILTGTPNNEQVGSHAIAIEVRDKAGNSNTQNFAIAVANVNDAPTLANPIPNQPATESTSFNFTIAADTFFDVDAGDNLNLTATSAVNGEPLPSWLNFDGSTGTFSGTPTRDESLLSITITATDSAGASVNDTFEVTIEKLNNSPPVTVKKSGNFSAIPSSNPDLTNALNGVINVNEIDKETTAIAPQLTEAIGTLGNADNNSNSGAPVAVSIANVAVEQEATTQAVSEAIASDVEVDKNAIATPVSPVLADNNLSSVTSDEIATTIAKVSSVIGATPQTASVTSDEIATTIAKVSSVIGATPQTVSAVNEAIASGQIEDKDKKAIANTLSPFLGDKKLSSLTGDEIGSIISNLSSSGVLPSGINFDNATLSSLLSSSNLDLTSLLSEAEKLLSDGGSDRSDLTLLFDSGDCDCPTCEAPTSSGFAIALSNALNGDEANNTIIGGSGQEAIAGWGGNDILIGDRGSNTIVGGIGSNVPVGNQTDRDLLFGNRGNDYLFGCEGDDNIHAGKDNDIVWGGKDNDLVFGDLGDDTIMGDRGNDALYGGTSDPALADATGRDMLFGLSGDDFLNGNQEDDTLCGSEGDDTAKGGKNNDIVRGDAGNDWLFGDLGDDTLCAGEGNDTLSGGNGSTVPISSEGERDVLCGGAGNDLLFGNEGQDMLKGGDGDDTLYGGKDSDTLAGGAGNDWIVGDLGNDLLIGNAGRDTFVLSPTTDSDAIGDFEDGIDFLCLDGGLTFSQLSITQGNGFTSISAGDRHLVTLIGVQANLIGSEDFTFGSD